MRNYNPNFISLSIYWLDFCPMTDKFLTCSRDMTLRIWDLNATN